MTTMFATRIARRRAVAFTVLLSISLMLMAVSSSPLVTEFQNAMHFALRPVQGAIQGVADTVANTVGAIGEIDRLHSDNAALRRENERLEAENMRARATQRENEQLAGLLQLKSSFQYETAAAAVIARESSEARRSITLSKGTDAGIEKGDVVIAEGGALVGRVVEVGPTFAMVTLISDRTSTVVGETETSITLGWTASTAADGAGYRLFRDATVIGTTTSTSYAFTGLTCGASYTFGVEAFDAAGNHSSRSTTMLTTSACSDTAPPTSPASLQATGSTATSVALSWGASTDNVGVIH